MYDNITKIIFSKMLNYFQNFQTSNLRKFHALRYYVFLVSYYTKLHLLKCLILIHIPSTHVEAFIDIVQDLFYFNTYKNQLAIDLALLPACLTSCLPMKLIWLTILIIFQLGNSDHVCIHFHCLVTPPSNYTISLDTM